MLAPAMPAGYIAKPLYFSHDHSESFYSISTFARAYPYWQSLYDEDNELKKQMDVLLKKEEHLQKLFEEKDRLFRK